MSVADRAIEPLGITRLEAEIAIEESDRVVAFARRTAQDLFGRDDAVLITALLAAALARILVERAGRSRERLTRLVALSAAHVDARAEAIFHALTRRPH